MRNQEVLRSTSEGYQGVSEVFEWLLDRFTFYWWSAHLGYWQVYTLWCGCDGNEGQNAPDLELVDNQLCDVSDEVNNTDDNLLCDLATPTPKLQYSKTALKCILTTAPIPPLQIILTIHKKYWTPTSSYSMWVDHSLSTPPLDPVSFQQTNNSSQRVLMSVTLHLSPQSTQPKH